MKFVHNDGGRDAAGYKGDAGDCVTRSIAIATGRPYQEVYDALNKLAKRERTGVRKRGISSARSGVHKQTYRRYLESIGWRWTPTMQIGVGCRVHLVYGELPPGRLIVSVSKHLTAVIDGVIHDTHDPQRRVYWYDDPRQPGKATRITERCVYGYFQPTAAAL
jgi:hypothetical protein